MQKVLITGGAGYVGTLLTQRLLDKGYFVVVYDMLYYGCKLQGHPHLQIIQADIRDTVAFQRALSGDVEVVIHLACISNDPSFHLDPSLSKAINYDCFEPMVIAAKERGVRRFIYASTSSVYGISSLSHVTEEHPLVPLTLYNQYKGMCEPLLFRHQSDHFVCVAIRPATICGYSPRMRFDLTVNILTNHAVNQGKILVFGGTQLRPNVHIDDMCDLYEILLELPDEKIAGEVFNFGYQNQTIAESAEVVRNVVHEEFPERGQVPIEVTASDDKRSYHICSKKIQHKLGIVPKKTIEDAVRDICRAFKAQLLPNPMEEEGYYNVRSLKSRSVF